MYVKWLLSYGELNEIQDGRRPPSWIWFSTPGMDQVLICFLVIHSMLLTGMFWNMEIHVLL
jgi:hypothetical protein